MKTSELFVKTLKWGIYISLFLPLIIFSQHLSPFHFGKMVIFRILVEIMAVIYILLIFSTGKKYLPKFNPIVIAVTIFTGLYALCSFTAVDFNYAFWGTLERMGGLFSFLHFWIWFIILISIFQSKKDWLKLLKISVFVGFLSILFGYGQYFKLGDFFVGWQHQGRMIGTIGNAALFGGYLLFVLFLSFYLLVKRDTNDANKHANDANKKSKKKQWKWFYGVVLILGIPMLHLTAVRGSIAAFWGGVFLLGLIYLFGLKNKKKIKQIIVLGLILLVILIGFVWINKDKAWVENTGWLRRMTSISFESRTLQTRLWSWESGWQGFKEKPILGWGPENFVLAHAMHFHSTHFTGMGSETIWDRAHNIVLETLTTMGILGFLSYFSIFAIIYWFLIKGFKKKKIDLNTLAVFGVMLVVYIVHNLFIFDTMANYLMFFLVLGYLDHRSGFTRIMTRKDAKELRIGAEKKINPGLVIILAILAIILIYKTNIEPAMANYTCTRAILAGRAGNAEIAFEKYKQALSYNTYQGKNETRQKLAMFIMRYSSVLHKKGEKTNSEMSDFAIKEFERNIEQHSKDYILRLYLTRLYVLLIPEDVNYWGAKAEEQASKALEINDKNPRVWYEFGQAKLSQKKYNEAVEAFERALELNPEVSQSLWFLGITYLKAGKLDKSMEYVEKAIEKGYNYKSSASDITRLINLYSKAGKYDKLVECYKKAIELEPNNAQLYASLASAYAETGDKKMAIFYAEKAIELDPNLKKEAQEFINSLE